MNILKLVSKLTNESERDLQNRFQRAYSLITGADDLTIHHKKNGVRLSGRIFLMTTWRKGKGEEDFLLITKQRHHKVTKLIRLNWLLHGENAIVEAIKENWNLFSAGDILVIARGGGDTSEKHFLPYKVAGSVEAIDSLKLKKNVIIVTGIGHSTDYFEVEKVATFNQATPTDAAFKVCELLEVSK